MKYILGAVIFFTAIFIYGNNHFKLKRITVTSSKIPKAFDGYKILHLSDLHNTSYGTKNKRLRQAVNQLHMDVIFYTGDMVDERSFTKRGFYDFLEGTKKNIPSYYIFGNHEDGLESTQKEKLLEKLRKEGVNVLRNNHQVLERKGKHIFLHGLDIPRSYLRNTYNQDGILQLSKEELEKRLGQLGEGYHILLAHNPLYGDAYIEAGFDLTFSGHVHGGMIWIPFKGGLLAPDRSLWPKFSKGKYETHGKSLIVSPGIGGHKMRILNPPYLYLITLKWEPS